MSQIENILSFSKFLTKFKEVERTSYFSIDPKRRENDAEHSWQLAMLCRYVISTQKLSLSLEKILQYCMVHDIVEIYAGDIEALNRTPEEQHAKELREDAALKRIKQEFPEGHELRSRLENYERKEDDEAKFVYAMDKVIPAINIYNDGGYRRKERKTHLDNDLRPSKEHKVKISSEVDIIRNDLYALMKEKEKEMFFVPEIQ